jgi:hypothetical protein
VGRRPGEQSAGSDTSSYGQRAELVDSRLVNVNITRSSWMLLRLPAP